VYIGGLGVGFLAGPLLSEVLRRKYAMLLSLMFFSLFLLGAGFAPNLIGLSILRGLAAVAGASAVSVGMSILFDMYPRSQRTFAYLLLFGAFSVSAAFG
jgi:AAHS family 4-hydroxybenzoate transporter-like MFS transporter